MVDSLTSLALRCLSYAFSLKAFGVSTRFVQDVVARFHEDIASELGSTAFSRGAYTGEESQPRPGASSRRSGGNGKQRKRGASRKASSDVSEPAWNRTAKSDVRLHAKYSKHVPLTFTSAGFVAKRRRVVARYLPPGTLADHGRRQLGALRMKYPQAVDRTTAVSLYPSTALTQAPAALVLVVGALFPG